jgi:hypothetical protein
VNRNVDHCLLHVARIGVHGDEEVVTGIVAKPE